jgi:hypothetical protein
MKKDPRQFTNLAGDAGHAAVVKEMRARLAAQLTALSKR